MVEAVRELTERQQEVLEKIETQFQAAGRFPTYQELMVEFNYKSTNSIHQIMQALVKKGYLAKNGTQYTFAPSRYIITPQRRDEAIKLYREVLDRLVKRQIEAGIDKRSARKFQRDQIERFLDTLE